MSLQPSVRWNKHTDMIEGFEDTGTTRTSRIADHVLVFMIRGLFGKWKQPVAYSYCEAATKTPALVMQIKNVIREIHKTDLKVVACVCDQGSTNVAAINSLIADTRATYLRKKQDLCDRIFEIDGKTIIPIFDPPHLLKGIRNSFMQKDLYFTDENNQQCKGSWQHILAAYFIDAPQEDYVS
ncbi:transposase protein [Holotrichia oblita]|uniref:Transposase protein n=1 Tax=Holotrichia oblita TaxID=644536 RepID=A0ACB9SJ68_HOLOL|nr:transposase protein [Holotrichia oblita]